MKDRRIQKTHGLLRGALTSLIGEKPYDNIVVKEILDRANVGRSTFYTHFRDKDDLLLSGIHDMLGLVHSPTSQAGGKRQDRILWFSLPILEYHYQHRHPGGDRIGTRGRAILHEHLRKVLAGLVADAVKKDLAGRRKSSRQVPGELLSEFLASTFVLVLNWWLDKKMSMSPKEINEVFQRFVSPTLAEM